MQAADTSESIAQEIITAVPKTATAILSVAGTALGIWATGTLFFVATEASRLGPSPTAVYATVLGAFYCALGAGRLAARSSRLPIFGTYLGLSFALCALSAISPILVYAAWARGELLAGLAAVALALGFGAGAGERRLEILGAAWPASRVGLALGAIAAAWRVEENFFLFRAVGWLAAAHALLLLTLVVIFRARFPRGAKAWMAIGLAACTAGLLFAANGEEYYRWLTSYYFP